MRAGSLCTGILGLDLAVEAYFGCELAWCSEIEEAPARVIERHRPGVPNLGDLTIIDWHDVEPVDVLTGGYPCQPWSHAGLRKGSSDERHLWPYILEALRVLRPRYGVFENVAGHLSLGFREVLESLAEAGFDAEWRLLRASDVGAPHRRARLFFVVADADADARGERRFGRPGVEGDGRQEAIGGEAGYHAGDGAPQAAADADAEHDAQRGGVSRGLAGTSGAGQGDSAERQRVRGAADQGPQGPEPAGRRHLPAGSGQPAADPNRGRLEVGPQLDSQPLEDSTDWDSRGGHADGLGDVAWGQYRPAIERWERILGRPAPAPVDDAGRLEPAFVEWMCGYPAGWVDGLTRTQALKALGNSVVPQQAFAALEVLVPAVEARRAA